MAQSPSLGLQPYRDLIAIQVSLNLLLAPDFAEARCILVLGPMGRPEPFALSCRFPADK